MGADVGHIVRHDFKKNDDLNACRKFVVDTAYKLKSQLHDDVCVYREDLFFEDSIEKYGWYDSLLLPPDEFYPATFVIRLNRYDVTIFLRHGFWEVESYYKFFQIISQADGTIWLREYIYDIVKALGANEVWHADEYHIDNVTFNVSGSNKDIDEVTFEEWLAYAQKSGIKEFDESYWVANQYNFDALPRVFHDDLSGLDERLSDLQAKWSNYKVFGLFRMEAGHIGLRDDKLYWLNDKTGRERQIEKKEFDNIRLLCDVENYVTDIKAT